MERGLGQGRADVVIQNSYADVKNAVITAGDSEITAEGLFSLGYPRKDGGEEINAREIDPPADGRPETCLRLDDYDMDGVVSGDYHVYGNYETPLGFGKLLVEEGVAYGETFDSMSAGLRFEGNGVRLDTIQIAKSTGLATGGVGRLGRHLLVQRRWPRDTVESLDRVIPAGAVVGTAPVQRHRRRKFDEPRYDVKLRVDDDLFAGDEGVGQVSGRLSLRGETVNADFEAASPRLFVSGSGRLELTDAMDAEMSMRSRTRRSIPTSDSSSPGCPFTTAVASGTVKVAGALAVDRLVSTTVEQLGLKLFDYALANDGPIELSLNGTSWRSAACGSRVKAPSCRWAARFGCTTVWSPSKRPAKRTWHRRASSATSGAVARPSSVRSKDRSPSRRCPAARGSSAGDSVTSAPHGLEAINGTISFDGSGIRSRTSRPAWPAAR